MEKKNMAFAGSWYPATAKECEASIQEFLKEKQGIEEGNFIGGIVPHAGWYYSGSIACRVIASLKSDEKIDTIILFGAHMHKQSEPFILAKGCLETPFGDIEGDTILIPATVAGGLEDKIQSVLVKIFTLTNDDNALGDDVDETFVLTATTTDTKVTNANTEVSDNTLIVESHSVTTLEDTSTTFSAPAGYTYSLLGQGANGTVTVDGSGFVTYDPDTDTSDPLDTHFSGTDSFTIIKTNDDSGISTMAEVNVEVRPVADKPIVTITVSDPVADTPPDTEYVLNGSFETFTNSIYLTSC